MRIRAQYFSVLVILTLTGRPCCKPACADAADAERPNVIFVLADDLGWSEPCCYGNGFNETPHIDQLAAEGMRFTQAYAAAPVCSPYRAALLTGQHPARIGLTDYLRPNSANALSTDHVTLAEMFRDNGYETGMIGKWHLTGYKYHAAEFEIKPHDHGFQYDFATEVKSVGNGANFWPYVFRDQPIRWIDIAENRLGEQEFLVDRMNREAADFVERNHDRPFFLYLSHYATHSILNGRPDMVDKYRRKHVPGKSSRTRCYLCEDHGYAGDHLHHWAQDHNPHLAAMLESIDDGIGRLTEKLQQHGIADRTIFVFTSDNGGETNVTSNAPLRGGKSQLYEGGIRVPLIVRWPAQVPPGTVNRQLTINTDFYPTLLEAANITPAPEQQLDGTSMLQTWKAPNIAAATRCLYWHYPLDRPHFLGGRSAGAVRSGNWKLIEFFDTSEHELYSLSNDLSERRNVAADHPDIAARLKKRLDDWRQKTSARMPSPPLLTQPKTLDFADHFSPKQVSSRWFFSKDWSAENGVLQRADDGNDSTRIFLREYGLKNCLIRFDFQLQQAQDLRLVTGSSGHYNAVIHIRPDHFFIQTARDPDAPYFSYRHGECAIPFDPERWYTMTVEFLDNRLVAHIDHEHLAYAEHPILDRERTYFAFQVDDRPAAIDNVLILKAAAMPKPEGGLQKIEDASGRFPVSHTLQEQFDIRRTNAHEWLYQHQPEYRALVDRVDELDEKNRKLFPDVFRSHKEYRMDSNARRKQLLQSNTHFREKLLATHQAKRAIEAFLIARQPGVEDLPDSRRKREIERLRQQFRNTDQYRRLVAASDQAQQALESTWPDLFRSDDEIAEIRKKHRQAAENDPVFQSLVKARAAAWRAQQDYLFENDAELAELKKLLESQ